MGRVYKLVKKADADQPRNSSKDPLHAPNGPMTRYKTLKETLNALVLKVTTKSELQGPLEYQEETLVHLIRRRGPIQPYLGHEVSTAKGLFNLGFWASFEWTLI